MDFELGRGLRQDVRVGLLVLSSIFVRCLARSVTWANLPMSMSASPGCPSRDWLSGPRSRPHKRSARSGAQEEPYIRRQFPEAYLPTGVRPWPPGILGQALPGSPAPKLARVDARSRSYRYPRLSPRTASFMPTVAVAVTVRDVGAADTAVLVTRWYPVRPRRVCSAPQDPRAFRVQN